MPSNTTFTAQVGVAARAKPARRTRNQALPSGEWCITADGLVDWVDSTEPAEHTATQASDDDDYVKVKPQTETQYVWAEKPELVTTTTQFVWVKKPLVLNEFIWVQKPAVTKEKGDDDWVTV